jgi:adenine-specific DNA-methyltransferase
VKYMGSKSQLLRGPLGRMLLRESAKSSRFVDLFCGAGSVSRFVAVQREIPVLSSDLQKFATVLSAAVIERTEPYLNTQVTIDWCKSAAEHQGTDPISARLAEASASARASVMDARRLSADHGDAGFILRDYGGHYFSPLQARQFDVLYQSLPEGAGDRTIALAALIQGASRCAAAPGHTAQPFQPTDRLIPHIQNAWSRSAIIETQRALDELVRHHALVPGTVANSAADEVVHRLGDGDFVFLDPPYSDVQYSRFYHVLEGISRGGWPSVSGSGRAPDKELRPTSDFSLRSKSAGAMRTLLQGISDQGCNRVAITFPNAEASNGLSAHAITGLAREAGWRVRKTLVNATHSTLGGAGDAGVRGSRKSVREALFLLVRT